jgi:hypothetical protein
VGETLTELTGVRRGLESAESRSGMAIEVAEAACRSYGRLEDSVDVQMSTATATSALLSPA